MGEAKRRGSFDHRREAAEIRHADEIRVGREQEIQKERSLTPEERASRHNARVLFTTIAGIALSSGLHTSVGKMK